MLAQDDQQEWGTHSALDVSGALRIEDDMAGAGARRSGLVRQARKPGHGASPRAPCYTNGANSPSSSHPEVTRSRCSRSSPCDCDIPVLMPGMPWQGCQRGHVCHEKKRFLSWQCRHLTEDGEFGQCSRRPTFGPRGTRTGLFCRMHKREGDVDVRNAFCRYPSGCARRPSHARVLLGIDGIRTLGPAELCAQHAPRSFVLVRRRHSTCAFANCSRPARYRVADDGLAVGTGFHYCQQHRPSHAVDCSHRVCQAVNCSAVARYGLPPASASWHAQGNVGADNEAGSSVSWSGPDGAAEDRWGADTAEDSSAKRVEAGRKGGSNPMGQRVFCRRHRSERHVCLDYRCSLCGCYGHWRKRCPLLAACTTSLSSPSEPAPPAVSPDACGLLVL